MNTTYQQLDVISLTSKAKTGDKTAIDKLVEGNVGLVWSVVRRFSNRGHELEDLFQIGCIGLIKAINKFDEAFNVKFSTYAVPMIIGEIKRFIRDDGIIKISRSLKETSNKLRITKDIMSKELGREPSISEIAVRLNVSPEELVMAQEATCSPDSLFDVTNDQAGSGSGTTLMDKIEDTETSNRINLIVDRLALRQILQTLDDREKQIIVLRYFKQKTQMQIADILGISQVQVSRIEKRILNDMRVKLKCM